MSPSRAISIEMQLLCACIRPAEAGHSVEQVLHDRDIDWSALLTLATNHHVLPWVYRSLQAADARRPGCVPPEYLGFLHRTCQAIAAHNFRAAATLQRLQQGMREQGIDLIPIKGPALAVLAHGSTSRRQFEDLDLLVRGEDLLPAISRLEEWGYALREIPPSADRRRYLATRQGWSLHRPSANPLDIKPVLISHTLSGPETVEFMAASCRTLDLGDGTSFRAPGPEAMLLAVCLDGAGEMWNKLSAVGDVARLLSVHAEADWAGLLPHAARFGHRRSLLVGVQVAERLLDAPVPSAFRAAIAQDSRSRRLAQQAAERLLTRAPRHTAMARQTRFTWQCLDRFQDRVRFVRRLLFVPGPWEVQAMPGRWAHPLHVLSRPFRLAWTVVVRRGRPWRVPVPPPMAVHQRGVR